MPSTSKRLTQRRLQAIARREQILETALRLFARHGFDGTSTKQIARAAGIAEGLIFHYFPTKEHLLIAMLETQYSYRGEFKSLMSKAEHLPVRELLHRVATSWLDKLRQEAQITLVLFGTAQTNPKVGAALRTLIVEEGVARLAKYLRARVQTGELRADLPIESSALMFFAPLMIFFLLHRHLPKEQWQERVDAFVSEMLSVWLESGQA